MSPVDREPAPTDEQYAAALRKLGDFRHGPALIALLRALDRQLDPLTLQVMRDGGRLERVHVAYTALVRQLGEQDQAAGES